jgi:hypothetical protein
MRDELRLVWNLPPEREFGQSGKEWFLQLIANVPAETRPKLLLLFWRVWHHRNNIVHGDGKAAISASVPFLQNYLESFIAATTKHVDLKGKGAIFKSQAVPSTPHVRSWWHPPDIGWTKVNVDGGWDSWSKKAGWGLIIRDNRGVVLTTAWQYLPGCVSAEQAEAVACLEGLKHVIDL